MGTRMAAAGVRRGIATWSQLTDEQKMLRDMCRTFADEELKPNAGMWDQKHMFPADAVKAMGEMGLLGVAQDDKYGGAGMDAMSYAIAVEEISRGCASAGVIMSAQNSLYCEPVGELSHPSWSLCTIHPRHASAQTRRRWRHKSSSHHRSSPLGKDQASHPRCKRHQACWGGRNPT